MTQHAQLNDVFDMFQLLITSPKLGLETSMAQYLRGDMEPEPDEDEQ